MQTPRVSKRDQQAHKDREKAVRIALRNLPKVLNTHYNGWLDVPPARAYDLLGKYGVLSRPYIARNDQSIVQEAVARAVQSGVITRSDKSGRVRLEVVVQKSSKRTPDQPARDKYGDLSGFPGSTAAKLKRWQAV